MNDRWLKAFKKYRERKYLRDLEKLRDNLAGQGLASSSVREDEERRLEEDYQDDLAMKEEEVRVQNDISRERWTSVWTNRILALVAIGSIYFSIVAVQNSKEAIALAKQEYSPVFDIEHQSGGPLITGTSTETIRFRNRGGTCYDLSAETFSFFEVGMGAGANQQIRFIPIDIYFMGHSRDECKYMMFWGSNDDYFVTFYNRGMAARTIGEYTNLVTTDVQATSTYIWLRHYVKLTYQDVYGDEKSMYYSFSPIESGIIDQAEWERMKMLYESSEKVKVDAGGKRIIEYLNL